jgi:hypothetical protein
MKDFKGVFVPPVKRYYFGKIVYGTPYFWPIGFNKNIISIRKLIPKTQAELEKEILDYPHYYKREKFKNIPMVRRAKDWIVPIFGNHYWIQIGWPWCIKRNELGWKDKYDSPRFEWAPDFYIFFFHWQFVIRWHAPDGDDDRYWEMILWWKHYANRNLHKARMTWPWRDMKTERSTWNPSYIIKRK